MALYTSRVENALHLVLNLARAGDGVAPSARELAEFQRLPAPFVRRILTELAHGDIVAGTEGVHGGWRLTRRPESISVGEVVDAVHGGAELFECREIRARCALWPDDAPPPRAVGGRCSIHAVMLSAEAAMRAELGRHSIGDLMDHVSRKTTDVEASARWFASAREQRVSVRTEGTRDE